MTLQKCHENVMHFLFLRPPFTDAKHAPDTFFEYIKIFYWMSIVALDGRQIFMRLLNYTICLFSLLYLVGKVERLSIKNWKHREGRQLFLTQQKGFDVSGFSLKLI